MYKNLCYTSVVMGGNMEKWIYFQKKYNYLLFHIAKILYYEYIILLLKINMLCVFLYFKTIINEQKQSLSFVKFVHL